MPGGTAGRTCSRRCNRGNPRIRLSLQVVLGASGPRDGLASRDVRSWSPRVLGIESVQVVLDESPYALPICVDLITRHLWVRPMRTSLITDALSMVSGRRNRPAGVIFHSDRGSPIHLGRIREILQSLLAAHRARGVGGSSVPTMGSGHHQSPASGAFVCSTQASAPGNTMVS